MDFIKHKKVIQDLIEYTKIPNDELLKLLARESYCYKREFVEKKNTSNHFFYIGSTYTIFGNAIHGEYIEDTDKIVNSLFSPTQAHLNILEFGCGTGNISLSLKERYNEKIDVSCAELSAVQKDFVKFRFDKRNIPCTIVHDWEFKNGKLSKLGQWLDLVVSLDVMEHIEGYELYLETICSMIKKEGLLWEYSPFLENRAADPCHCVPDNIGYHNILKKNGFILWNDKIKLSEGFLWKKI